jgi:hypothetical protein
MMHDELLQPTVTASPARGALPWRVQSQFWVAFFGGALPCGIIAIINARRLGIAPGKRWLMGATTAIALGVLLALWLRHPMQPTYGEFLAGGRPLRWYSRIAAVLLYLALAALQRKADTQHQIFGGGEYSSLWAAGLAAVFLGGFVQLFALAGGAWYLR